MPAGLAALLEPIDEQLLIPVEESTLRPVALATATDDDEDRPASRIAPALWSIPAKGLPLVAAVPWLAALDAQKQPPALRALAAASQLVLRMVARGDYAPAPQPGVVVSRLEPGGKASVAGIKPYEIVTHVNDEPVPDVAAFQKLCERGSELRLSIKRMAKGRIVTLRP